MNIEMTKKDICDILMQAIIQGSLDKDIRNKILDKYEDELYYEDLVDIYDEIGSAYFKLGFEIYSLMLS